MGEIDPAFVQEQEHRPKLSIIKAKGIPEIDLSPLFHRQVPNPPAVESLVKEIRSACKEWGFFQVTNHGVPPSLRHKLEEASRVFFAQSEKKKVVRQDMNLITQWTNQSPQYPPNFRVIIEEYIEEMEKMAYKLLELIALSLGDEAKRFEEFFKDQTSFIRFNHYPSCPYPHLALALDDTKMPVR
ncbi:hypothetical protein KIW84_073129 [Lathyrus oleraceus]|uniref:Non-haem dioxygenase N-terminal domain-containing protein n=1 Tax=Pisum sativum TaxID=3888 RepID=A0A9D4VN20_PEA|nr:hypothetical protein KIW84_073129 [Pisum sativum]